VSIKNLAVSAVIGVEPNEREKPQRILASAKIDYGYDDAQNFADYVAVTNLITTRLTEGRFGLLEEALNAIAPEIFQLNPLIVKVKLALEKPELSPNFKAVVSSIYSA
jgi:dihydroneopterin aldolase